MSSLPGSQIVAKPGDNGSPPGGACKFSGRSHPSDGPYISTTAGYVSKYAATGLARDFDLLIAEEAQDRFEKLLRDLATAKQGRDSIAAAHAALELEFASEREERAASDARVAELEERLAVEKTVADIAADYLTNTAKPKSKQS